MKAIDCRREQNMHIVKMLHKAVKSMQWQEQKKGDSMVQTWDIVATPEIFQSIFRRVKTDNLRFGNHNNESWVWKGDFKFLIAISCYHHINPGRLKTQVD